MTRPRAEEANVFGNRDRAWRWARRAALLGAALWLGGCNNGRRNQGGGQQGGQWGSAEQSQYGRGESGGQAHGNGQAQAAQGQGFGTWGDRVRCSGLEELRDEVSKMSDQVDELHHELEERQASEEEPESESEISSELESGEPPEHEGQRAECDKVDEVLRELHSMKKDIDALEAGTGRSAGEGEKPPKKHAAKPSSPSESTSEKSSKKQEAEQARSEAEKKSSEAQKDLREAIQAASGGEYDKAHQKEQAAEHARAEAEEKRAEADAKESELGKGRSGTEAKASSEPEELADIQRKLHQLDAAVSELEVESAKPQFDSTAAAAETGAKHYDVTGKIESYSPRKLLVRNEQGKLLEVEVEPQTQVHRGDEEISAAQLQRGVKIKASVEVKGGKPEAHEIEVLDTGP